MKLLGWMVMSLYAVHDICAMEIVSLEKQQRAAHDFVEINARVISQMKRCFVVVLTIARKNAQVLENQSDEECKVFVNSLFSGLAFPLAWVKDAAGIFELTPVWSKFQEAVPGPRAHYIFCHSPNDLHSNDCFLGSQRTAKPIVVNVKNFCHEVLAELEKSECR